MLAWLLANGPSIVSALAGVSGEIDKVAHSLILAQTGKDHGIVLDTVNNAIQAAESHLASLKALVAVAPTPKGEEDEQANPPA